MSNADDNTMDRMRQYKNSFWSCDLRDPAAFSQYSSQEHLCCEEISTVEDGAIAGTEKI